MILLSACIITYNEEKNIARCIDALKNVADEIIVVDSFSEDNTVSVAEALGAKVFQKKFEGYGPQKYFAQEKASHSWILSVDADEVVSPELEKSILAIKARPEFDAYKTDILPNYCGHWIRHCGWYPQPKLRIWNKEKGSMVRDSLHEGIVMNDPKAPVGRLKGDLLHYSYKTISQHMQKMENYTEIAARAAVARGKNIGILKLLIGPQWRFFNDFILKRGFLDGYYGYIVCRTSAIGTFIKYAKTRQYARLKKQGVSF